MHTDNTQADRQIQTDEHYHTFTMAPVASLNIDTFSDNLFFVSDDEHPVSFILDNSSPYCKTS